MARKPNVPCADCGSLMWQGTGSLPPGQARCRPCRRRVAATRMPPQKVPVRPRQPKQGRHCEICEAAYQPSYSQQRTCSRLCGHLLQGHRLVCDLGPTHPVMQILHPPAEKPPIQPEPPTWRTPRECPGCGCTFCPIRTPRQLACTKRCARRVAKRIRRGREAGAVGTWIWSDFMRIAAKFDYRCAYCGTKPNGQLDPDHVLALSRGGSNSATNLLPACRPCNRDKRDLTLDEWASDRARRGKAPRETSWATEDRRYWHLTETSSLFWAA